ncbi:hypothetical protein MBANPS3_008085 [Mucor bainieri]
MELAIIEVSGPNSKADTTHFLEDKKKIAKNLKHMYKAILSMHDNPTLESKLPLKVYGFHIYLNTLYTYSLRQPLMNGPYIFQQEFSMQLCHHNVVLHSLPAFVSELWKIHDLLEEQHEQLVKFVYSERPTPESSVDGPDQEEPYIPPRKRQKANSS